jgi:hypothetical protein
MVLILLRHIYSYVIKAFEVFSKHFMYKEVRALEGKILSMQPPLV